MLSLSDKIRLPDVTLISVEGRSQGFFAEMAHKALCFCLRDIEFGDIKLLTPHKPRFLHDEVKHISIEPLKNVQEYSKFIFGHLHSHVETTHCLIVQKDGLVINPKAWRADFLDYDYIGAPWPQTTAQRIAGDFAFVDLMEAGRVGNGGFSLRSKLLLKHLSKIDYELFSQLPEDVVISRILRDYFQSLGVKFAPLKLASLFALEHYNWDLDYEFEDVFGYHARIFSTDGLLMSLDHVLSGLNLEVHL